MNIADYQSEINPFPTHHQSLVFKNTMGFQWDTLNTEEQIPPKV